MDKETEEPARKKEKRSSRGAGKSRLRIPEGDEEGLDLELESFQQQRRKLLVGTLAVCCPPLRPSNACFTS